jgi:hypothetical protein
MTPPTIAIVHIENPYWRNLHLWLPLFLLWIPLVLLAPLILLVVLIVCLVMRISAWQAIATFWAISCNLPGTEVHVRAEGKTIRVKVL